MFWFVALKNFLSAKFNEFFSNVPGQADNPLASGNATPQSVEMAMNAQIRALTKGDITKEKQVLDMDLYRALAELNEQAREYKEMKSKLPTK